MHHQPSTKKDHLKITLLISLHGGNKTAYAQQHLPQGAIFIDNPSDSDIVASQDVEELWIADYKFCDSNVLQKFMRKLTSAYPYAYIRYIYWENDLESCWKNIQKDNKKVSRKFLEELSAMYAPPEGALKVLS
jgi:hypothetical protein